MAIEFVYFDLGNVLLAFSHQRGIAQIASAAGIPEANVQTELIQSGLNQRYERGDLTTEEFHHQFCESTGTSISVEALTFAWSSIFSVNPQTLSIAASLRAAGNRLGILSNTCAAHWEYVVEQFRGLVPLFDTTITSYQTRALKPAPAIYEAAQTAVGLAPEQIFFTDDRRENVEAARRLGWQSEVFTDHWVLATALERQGIPFNR